MPASRDSRPVGTVAILGVGLIGGSLGMALRKSRTADSVVGWDTDVLAISAALSREAVDRLSDTAEDAVSQADLVVLAPPTESIIPLLSSIAGALSPRAVVTDVGSVKARVVKEAEQILSGRFVGGHPMAGVEESGIAAASPTLFEGAAWILTPTKATDASALDCVSRVMEAIGARPRICEPAKHDQIVAAISHLPHLVAYGLADAAGRHISDEWLDLIAGSFRDGSRVALSNPGRWAEILLENRVATAEALDTFIAWAISARDALRSGSGDVLEPLLSGAHQARKRFPR